MKYKTSQTFTLSCMNIRDGSFRTAFPVTDKSAKMQPQQIYMMGPCTLQKWQKIVPLGIKQLVTGEVPLKRPLCSLFTPKRFMVL